jgi:FG-GAP-like repeat
MPLSRFGRFNLAALLMAAAIVVLPNCAARAQISSFSVGTDNTTTYPSSFTSFPDEHVTFMPSSAANGYLVFGSSAVTGGMGGAVVMQTPDLQTFSFATSLGYNEQVMNPPVAFSNCNPTYDAEFDENYAGPGTVVQDPTLPPGNLIMIYEAENHCPGGVNQFDYYATAGFARSTDNGQTWPSPIPAEFGGPNRYPVLKSSTPEPTSPENPQVNLGNAIPTAYVNGYDLYVAYEYITSPTSPATNMLRVARANLITDNSVSGGTSTLQFHKWYNGSFSQAGIGGLDTSPLPTSGCPGTQRQGSISRDDDLGLYVMIFLCIYTNPTGQAGWYYSTATSLAQEDWTTPQLISGSLGPFSSCNNGNSSQFDGFYPSMMSPGAPQGHIHNTGSIYFLNGCEAGSGRLFNYRSFTITGTHAPISLTDSHDFNGDGMSDVLWRDTSGNVGMWLMNGSTMSQSTVLGNVQSTWSIVGQRDFNGDGNSDILWRDSSGNVGIWLMNGTSIISSIVLGNVPNNWSVTATGDFNGDGNADILWRDTAGDVAVWLMNGTTIQQAAVIGNISTNWAVAGADGHGDIFWRNAATGEVGMWKVSGTMVTQSVDFGAVPLSWKIAGIGDFDGNGSEDILWRDTSGNVGIWLLNGTQVLSTAVLGNVPLNWTITQTGDYGGIGTSDILWSDSAGDVGAWFMDGATISSTVSFGNVGTSWTVQSFNAD